MLDISKEKVNINCPSCNGIIKVTLSQAANEETIVCTSCQSDIHLQDNNNSVKKSIKNVNQGFKNLEKTLKSLNRKN